MKIYLDTTVLVAFLFGELSDVDAERQEIAAELFELINASGITAFISLYALQELILFVYDNYSPAEVKSVLRLAMLTLFRNEVMVLPLLDRIDTFKYSRLVSVRNRSDRSHLISALKNDCDYILSCDDHILRAEADDMRALKPEEFLDLIKASMPEEER